MGLLKVSRQEIGACVERIERLRVGQYTADEAWECLEAVLPTLVKLTDGAHLALEIRDHLANGEPQQAANLLRVAPRHRSFTTFLVSV